jgi:hypothetical protein
MQSDRRETPPPVLRTASLKLQQRTPRAIDITQFQREAHHRPGRPHPVQLRWRVLHGREFVATDVRKRRSTTAELRPTTAAFWRFSIFGRSKAR